ncbi:MAG: anthranilate phosphoribosyltransferase [Candidatus Dormibacteraeota bacterium]|nr:anthranilate phosphoribosyltransferase [Candidatus Dormibacteraeota bacterium]MBV9525810.1 anthranilate phosphoribosyltransferase [Candidatus Dormibacteraeota bacterium]
MTEHIIRAALDRVVAGEDLDTKSAREVMDVLMEGAATQAQVGALLAALRTKGETVDEITGMVESMRAHAVTVQLDVDAVDTCGTGGDGHGTFNISTAAAVVTAGAGCAVAKHGNRAASSRCGSADVLEALGVAISLPPEGVRRCVDEAGIGFFYAPAFHPAMRHVAATRRELGFRTVFNMLGPLANPARVRHQALGVGDARLAPLMAGVLQRLGHERALVFTGPDGLDELGLHGVAHCYDVTPSAIVEFDLDASAYGLHPAPITDLHGGDAAENARTVRAVLEGVQGPARDVVVFNAAAALVAAGKGRDFADGVTLAQDSIDRGAARERLDALVAVSNREAA